MRGRRGGAGRVRAGAAVAALLVVTACLPGSDDPDQGTTTPGSTTPGASTPGSTTSPQTGGDQRDPAGDDQFGEACTGEGAYEVTRPVYLPLEGAPEVDGDLPLAALAATSLEGPTGRVLVQERGGSPTEVEGVVGHSATAGPWRVTIRSICSGQVRFDLTLA
ncbi:hypothetical protein GCM10027055_14340 [Janibacter alkaliphilus]